MKQKNIRLYPFFSTKKFKYKSIITLTSFAMITIMLFSGCTSAKFILTGQSHAAKADDCTIEVFSSKTPERDYEELGIIEGEGSFGGDTMEKILPKMKIEACRAGGDAIILKTYQKYVDDTDLENLNITATVIKWTE